MSKSEHSALINSVRNLEARVKRTLEDCARANVPQSESNLPPRRLFAHPNPPAKRAREVFDLRADSSDYEDLFPLRPTQTACPVQLDSVLLGVLKHDTELMDMDEALFKESMKAESEFFASLSDQECKKFAPQFRDALVIAAPDREALSAISIETDEINLRDAWVGTVKAHTDNYGRLFAGHGPPPKPAESMKVTFLDSVRASIRKKRSRASGGTRPPKSRNGADAFLKSLLASVQKTSTSASEVRSPVDVRPAATKQQFATPVKPTAKPISSLSRPDKAKKLAVAAKAMAALIDPTSETTATLPPFNFDAGSMAHINALRKHNGDVAKAPPHTVDWVAASFGAEPSDIHALLKGAQCHLIGALIMLACWVGRVMVVPPPLLSGECHGDVRLQNGACHGGAHVHTCTCTTAPNACRFHWHIAQMGIWRVERHLRQDRFPLRPR